MVRELDASKVLLDSKDREHKDLTHTMERKILHEKNKMKIEMADKVNDVVNKFQTLSDRQMAEVYFLLFRQRQTAAYYLISLIDIL